MATLAHFLQKKIPMALGFILSPWCEISTPKKEKEKEKEKKKEKQTGSSR
jgi:hypothetical protein